MNILGIETSCDETSVCIVEIDSEYNFKLLSHRLFSQVDMHKEFGGVVPTIAKREHSEKLVPLMRLCLKDMGTDTGSLEVNEEVLDTLSRNEILKERINEIAKFDKPKIDAIFVTSGPGLEPALWTGISFAKALSLLWDIPLYPVNHMIGHLFSPFILKNKIMKPPYPFLSLLVSGGHTELILVNDIDDYKKIGETKDDAVGESFDKVARLLSFSYPGGPIVSKLASKSREQNREYKWKFPRPLLRDGSLDFSFSGLKTAVRYAIEKETLSDTDKEDIAKEFEDAAIEVLVTKLLKSVEKYGVINIALGGGVAANTYLQAELIKVAKQEGLELFLPSMEYTGDNAVMIAVAGYLQYIPKRSFLLDEIVADSSLSI